MNSRYRQNKLARAVSIAALLGTAVPAAFTHATAATPVSPDHAILQGEILPTGKRITPEAVPGADFQSLNPGLPNRPDFLVDHAVDTAISPDGETLLILTSGYNRNNGASGSRVASESNEYVFVFDISGVAPVQIQAVQVANTFNGIAWNPNGNEFYVSGGVDDNVHVYAKSGATWAESIPSIGLGHGNIGLGVDVRPMAAGLAVNASGTQLLVTNYFNDSVSLIELTTRAKVGELDLRPGKNGGEPGTPGGTYPIAVAFKGDGKAYVSAQRDRELVVLSVSGP